jgi:hypothetical protein
VLLSRVVDAEKVQVLTPKTTEAMSYLPTIVWRMDALETRRSWLVTLGVGLGTAAVTTAGNVRALTVIALVPTAIAFVLTFPGVRNAPQEVRQRWKRWRAGPLKLPDPPDPAESYEATCEVTDVGDITLRLRNIKNNRSKPDGVEVTVEDPRVPGKTEASVKGAGTDWDTPNEITARYPTDFEGAPPLPLPEGWYQVTWWQWRFNQMTMKPSTRFRVGRASFYLRHQGDEVTLTPGR